MQQKAGENERRCGGDYGAEAIVSGFGRRAAMVRVCHLASGDLWAGAEAHIAHLLPELAKQRGVRLHAILLNEGLLAERLRESDIPVSVFSEEKLSTPGVLRAVVARLRDTYTELLHTHGYKQNILGAVAGKLANVRWVVRTEHGVNEAIPGWAGLRLRVYQALDELAAYHCSAMVAVSDHLAEQWRSTLKGRGPKITVVRNGVRLQPDVPPTIIARTRARLGIGRDQILFGFLGRMVPVKGLSDLIEAAALLHRREPRSAFVLAGDGPLRTTLEVTADELGLRGIVRFLGFTPDPGEVLAALDVFVLPSLGEGVPMALVEALALGKPVIATAVGGVAELLSSGVHALLVRPGAPAALAEACERLIADPALRLSLGRQARLLVEDRLTAGHMAAHVHNLYVGLAG